jgi:hypothetical protein
MGRIDRVARRQVLALPPRPKGCASALAAALAVETSAAAAAVEAPAAPQAVASATTREHVIAGVASASIAANRLASSQVLPLA